MVKNIWTDLPAAQKSPLKIHHVKHPTRLENIESLFVHVIHEKGRHSPYNESFEESTGSRPYFEDTGTIEAANVTT